MTKLSSSILIVCLLLTITSVQSYEDILSHLGTHGDYNRFTLLENLESMPREFRNLRAMDFDVVCDFIRSHFSHEDVSLPQIIAKFRQLFSSFRQEWVNDMVTKTMRAIGIDMDNEDLVRHIRANPKDYSIDYDTYKIATFRK